MSRIAKYIGYLLLFVVSFVIFLYFMFPYDVLKERLISGIERQLGGGIEVSAGELEPYWFTGVEIAKLTFSVRDTDGTMRDALTLDKIRMRVAFFSLLVGSPRVSYYISAGNGDVDGYAQQTADGIEFDADFDDFNVSAVKLLATKYGFNLTGKIDGSISMKIDRRRIARSSGEISIDLKDFKLGESTVNVGPMEMPLPPLTLTKSRGSVIKIMLGKGTALIDKIILDGGDLGLNITGKVFLANTVANSRFNLKGFFKASEVMDKALPFLFIVEKEKKSDGSYPLSVTGRISSPVVKVGNFTLPL